MHSDIFIQKRWLLVYILHYTQYIVLPVVWLCEQMWITANQINNNITRHTSINPEVCLYNSDFWKNIHKNPFRLVSVRSTPQNNLPLYEFKLKWLQCKLPSSIISRDFFLLHGLVAMSLLIGAVVSADPMSDSTSPETGYTQGLWAHKWKLVKILCAVIVLVIQ